MSRIPGNTNDKRFPCRKVEGKWLCRMCGTELSGRKTSFCGRRCLRDFFMQTDWTRVRKVIFARDGGVPLAAGGDEWDLNNLELSCPRCNIIKGAKLDG
ncbi:hypothetical protein KL86DPRO_10497 [uncultured delta proteobacterium]|uniref:HNH endonuclease n=1 Tax=uncultured delta proteobacterium TaxID=34034 RepID=A0A212J1L3_9DELT|nr:hypothetical protein KL86DPRO_10497 [uncultured delta proteobacterium]